MINYSKLTSKQILGFKEPEDLFSKDNFEHEYKELAKLWHPDLNKSPDATSVFKHIVELHSLATKKVSSWAEPNSLVLTEIKGTGRVIHKFPYLKKHQFELGTLYVANTEIIQVVNKSYADLFSNAKSIIGTLKYPSDKIKTEVTKYLPQVLQYLETGDTNVVVMKREGDLILLKDLLNYFNGKIDPKGVAWILSSLYNLVCYFKVTGLTHNNINLDTYFVSPEKHMGALLGGWFYSTEYGHKMKALPATIINNVPDTILQKKEADYRIDLNQIREVGKALCGDVNGVNLYKDKNMPSALLSWLLCASNGDAIKDYKNWQEVLERSFGKKRFTPMNVKFNDVYKEIN